MQFLTIYIDFKGKMVGIWLLFTDKLITCGQKWKFCAKTEKNAFFMNFEMLIELPLK
jgi:hypothetical protein